MKTLLRHLPLLAFASLIPAVSTMGADVSMTASDAYGTSSLISAGKWSDGQPPSPTNDYFSGPYFIRTPASSGSRPATNYTFAGHSLTLSQPGPGVARSIIFKGNSGDVIVIDNLTNVLGGILENGGSGNSQVTYTGNRFTIAADSAVDANQGPMTVGYPLVGAEGVILTNAGGNVITYTNDNSGFKGKFRTSPLNFGNGGGNTTIVLGGANSAPGNPSTFTPDQITLEGGTLQDNAGLTLNNPNSGITLLGNANINANSTTTLGEPVTDNGGGFSLTSGGTGTLVLNAVNTYSGGTTISAGTLRIGVPNALPVGPVSVDSTLDLNGISATIDGLSSSGTAGGVDNFASASVTLTVGVNGGSGTLSNAVYNSVGTVSLTKVGAGTQTLAGGYAYNGNTLVAGGTLNLVTSSGVVPSAAGDLVVSNGAVLSVDASSSYTTLPANNVVVGTNSTLSVLSSTFATALTANSSLTLRDNATVKLDYGTLAANPTLPAVMASSISAPGANITIDVSGIGFQTGTFALIEYSGTALPDLSNFTLTLSPGTFGSLENNTANHSIDLHITSVSKQLTWYGSVNGNWDLTSLNWKNNGVDATYQQYTNDSIIAGDGVTFDDTLFNDFVNPQPTNINVTGIFSPYPVVVNSTLPYRLSGSGGITGPTSLVISNTGSLTLLTSNSFTGGVTVNTGTLIVNNDSALGAAGVGMTLNGGTLGFAGNTTSTRPVTTTTAAAAIDVAGGVTAQLDGTLSAGGRLNKTGNGTLALTADDTVNGVLSVSAGTLSVTAGSLAFTGNPSYVAYLTNSATLNLSGSATLNSAGELRVGGSDTSGAGFDANGTVNMTGGNAYLSALTIARGNNNQNSCSGEVDISGGTMTSTNDVLVGFAGTGKGTLRISGTGTLNVGTTVTKWLRFGQWDTTSGEIDITGGSLNLNAGTSIKFNQNNSSGPKTFNQDGGAVTFYSDFATTPGGGGNLDLMLTGTATATNTYNLNGGTLTVPQVTSSGSAGTRIFNFNGGILKPTASSAAFFNLGTGNAVANVRNGGAIIDDGGFTVTIAQPLVHSTIAGDNATDGGLTKNGTGTVTLNGANTYTGDTTVNAGVLLISTASSLPGSATVADNATLSVVQIGGATNKMGDLTMNGAGAVPGATLGVALTAANDATVPFVNCGTLTLSGANTINLAGSVHVGTIALIRAAGSVAGTGTITNLVLPQGAEGSILVNFDGSFTTVSAVITSTGPGLTWTGGTNDLWDINTSVNWLLNSTPTTYQQTIIPGDAVTFHDSGSGTVTLDASVGPASLVISNDSTAYTFDGSGSITGPTGLKKLGSGTATMNLANSYAGDTVVSNGTLQVGNATAIPSGGNLFLGSSGTVELAGNSITLGELTGSGTIDNNSGQNPIVTFGTSSGGTWNGNILYHGGGGVELHKNGSGTWVVGGINHLDGGQPFSEQVLLTSGTVIITNGALFSVGELQLQIANGAGQVADVVVDGGTLAVSTNVLSIGYGANSATGSLTVVTGTVFHGGPGGGAFAAVGVNCIDVGAQGATGTLTVNGGQVLNNSPLYLGDGTGANGTLYLNGGLLQASQVLPNGTPTSSTAYFNGGTLQATTNSSDYLSGIAANVMGGGLVLDSGGYDVTIATTTVLQAGDGLNGGLVKTGSGALYLDGYNTYTGTTVVSNGLLAGIGAVSGPVIVEPGGSIGAGDAGPTTSGAALTIASSLTLQGAATFRVSNDSGFPLNDQIMGLTSVNYGGVLVVTNATSDGTPLTNAVFQLFSLNAGATHTGNFTSIVGSPGTGLAYSFDPASGQLSVVTSTIASNPTNITFTVSGNSLSLSWPEDHLGWILQSQTNTLAAGLGDNWIDIPGSGSVTNETLTIDPDSPAVFYRLRHP